MVTLEMSETTAVRVIVTAQTFSTVSFTFFFKYKRVQPVGLTSLSCNWVILHDKMYVTIQLNPTGIVFCYKNLSKNYVLPKKNIVYRY